MGMLVLGVFIGGLFGVALMAMLAIAKQEDEKQYIRALRSECCDYVVEFEPGFRCLKCGHFCKVVKEKEVR